jgi:hypothetical protein
MKVNYNEITIVFLFVAVNIIYFRNLYSKSLSTRHRL